MPTRELDPIYNIITFYACGCGYAQATVCRLGLAGAERGLGLAGELGREPGAFRDDVRLVPGVLYNLVARCRRRGEA